MLNSVIFQASTISYRVKNISHGKVLSLALYLLFLTITPVFSQIVSSDGIFTYTPPSSAEQERLSRQAAAFHPITELNPDNKRIVTKLSTNVYKISPWPQAGFNYDYYLYIPDDFASKYLFATSIASGGAQGMGPEYYSEWARNVVMKGNWETVIASGLKAALLFPAFDRPANSSAASLTRDAMLLKKDRLSRLDLQFVAMIDDARSFIEDEYDIQVENKILLAGFSTSGSFASRFSMMHPERVRAAAYGGTSFIHILPYTRDQKKRIDLIYPIGVSDWLQITGKQFDRDTYLKVPRFLSMGLLDKEDTTRYDGLYPSSMRSWIDSRLGSMEKRWNTVTKILEELDNFEYKLYREKGHTLDAGDYIAFLNRYNSYRESASPLPSGSASTASTIDSSSSNLNSFRLLTGNPSVIIKPIINTNMDGFITSIDISFLSTSGESILNPETTVHRIQIQIDVKPNSGYTIPASRNQNRAYDSPLLSADVPNHQLSKQDIKIDILMALYIAYEDFSGNQFLIMYKPK